MCKKQYKQTIEKTKVASIDHGFETIVSFLVPICQNEITKPRDATATELFLNSQTWSGVWGDKVRDINQTTTKLTYTAKITLNQITAQFVQLSVHFVLQKAKGSHQMNSDLVATINDEDEN